MWVGDGHHLCICGVRVCVAGVCDMRAHVGGARARPLGSNWGTMYISVTCRGDHLERAARSSLVRTDTAFSSEAPVPSCWRSHGVGGEAVGAGLGYSEGQGGVMEALPYLWLVPSEGQPGLTPSLG